MAKQEFQAQVLVSVVGGKGSAPREVGAWMQVFETHQNGSIGGGALEWEATKIAREYLGQTGVHQERVFALGPSLGQCCGGSVTLRFSTGTKPPLGTPQPLWIWGAGHVGRAVAQVLAPVGTYQLTVVDTSTARMPALPAAVSPLVAVDPLTVVPHAPAQAHHLIMTYAHDLDLALCHALLDREFASCGLIGSATKWTRFQRRLHAMGHSKQAVAQIICPIGDRSLGKHPQAIAIGVASAFLSRHKAAPGEGQ